MIITKVVAYKIWQIRQEIGVAGSNTYDWVLAERFLQGRLEAWDDDDIYVWFTELEENMVPRDKNLDNYPEM
jgi:hypothetical protein